MNRDEILTLIEHYGSNLAGIRYDDKQGLCLAELAQWIERLGVLLKELKECEST
jgi:hypothetical protein